ncbi:MAG: TIGR00269 family protein [Candidatus Methanospirareceae archaeon]
MKCDKCKNRAIIFQRYSGMHLCERHFVEDVERKVKRAMRKYMMVERNDRIAVALSGGKDSTVLLYLLKKIFSPRKDIKLFAITVDEGIKGYRGATISLARKITGELGIDHYIFSFKNEYGIELDDVIVGKEQAPCTFCGVLRKSILNRAARDLSATKVATGHDLDDEAQSVMMNYLKGDIGRLIRFMPSRVQEGFIPRIKPLRDVPEKEVTLYGIIKGLYTDLNLRECPYAHLSLRSHIRKVLNELEDKHPGIKYSLLRGFEKIIELVRANYPQIELSACKICGEPCIGDVCKACVLLGR